MSSFVSNKDDAMNKQAIIDAISILREATKELEDVYKAYYKEEVPYSGYVETTHFRRNVGNLAVWQVLRETSGFDVNNANKGEKELIEIAEKLSQN